MSQLIKYLECLVDNIFIQVNDKVYYKQVIGIPVGIDCAPLSTNLFLFHSKFKFMKETLGNNPCNFEILTSQFDT